MIVKFCVGNDDESYAQLKRKLNFRRKVGMFGLANKGPAGPPASLHFH